MKSNALSADRNDKPKPRATKKWLIGSLVILLMAAGVWDEAFLRDAPVS